MKLHTTLLILTATVVPALSFGGLKASETVSITTSGNTVRVRGSLIGANTSPDTVQYIGCQIRYDFGYCWARDAAGHTMMCSTAGAGHMDAMRAVNAASYLDFTIQAGSCTNIEVSTSSKWLTAVPVSPTLVVR